MAIDPAAISASPPIVISRVFATAPESPAASANGSVNPSDIPITTSRTKFPEVKCCSLCLTRAIAIGALLWVGFQIFLRQLHHVPLAFVGQLPLRAFERNPKRLFHFDPHFGFDVINLPGLVPRQVKADNLENALLVTPAANIHIFNIGELRQFRSLNSGLLTDLPHRRL